MARGRMLNKEISLSVKLNNLPDDTCRLLATWLVPHLDFRGVFYADANIVKSQVLPMREDVTVQRVQIYLDAIEATGLFKTFHAKDRKWMFWPGFTHNQKDLRRESSEYPPPPSDTVPAKNCKMPNEPIQPDNGTPEDIRQPSGNLPATFRPNLIEVNVIEDSAAKPAQAHSDSHSTSVSDSTKPESESAPTHTPIPQTDKTRAGNFANLIFERAMKVKENPALARVRNWGLAERIQGVCVDYVELAANTPVVDEDKGKWAKGAKDVLELFRQNGRAYSRAWMEQAIKTATFTHTHPMALDTAFRELFKKGWTPAGTPSGEGLVTAGFRFNDDGSVTQLVKAVAHV